MIVFTEILAVLAYNLLIAALIILSTGFFVSFFRKAFSPLVHLGLALLSVAAVILVILPVFGFGADDSSFSEDSYSDETYQTEYDDSEW